MNLPQPFIENSEHVHVMIETPKASRNKYAYDGATGCFMLKKVLPAGTAFPHDFGFIPGTKADDGDPLDILIMMPGTTYPGCLVPCRIIGMLEFLQQEKGKKPFPNNRLIGIPLEDHDHSDIMHIKDLHRQWLNELIGFMQYYNMMEDHKLKFMGIKGPAKSIRYIRDNINSNNLNNHGTQRTSSPSKNKS
jgi:inorganic pyrophosphatase